MKGWESAENRIAANPDGTLDEVVMLNCNIHLEQLDDNSFMLIAENDQLYYYVAIQSRSRRAKVDALIVENTVKEG